VKGVRNVGTGRHPKDPTHVAEGLGSVACAGGGEPGLQLAAAETECPIAHAADLERPDRLENLGLEEDIGDISVTLQTE
jgi:hypothetical protein